jgi:CBS-domain-containing membrane protein
MKVRDVMTRDVVSVTTNATYKELAQRLVRHGVSGVPVIDDEGTLVGIVTEADLIAKEAFGADRSRAGARAADMLSVREHPWATKAQGLTAADLMTTHVAVCRPDDETRAVARRMLNLGVKRMPVVDGELVGIVSRRDLLATFDRTDNATTADVLRIIRENPDMPAQCHLRASVDQGVVTLHGDVRYPWDMPVIVALFRHVPGVVAVTNRMRPRDPEPLLAPSNHDLAASSRRAKDPS